VGDMMVVVVVVVVVSAENVDIGFGLWVFFA
jgi:hypothetical protein